VLHDRVNKSGDFFEVTRTYSVACDIQYEDGRGGEGSLPDRVCGTVRVQHQAITSLIRDRHCHIGHTGRDSGSGLPNSGAGPDGQPAVPRGQSCMPTGRSDHHHHETSITETFRHPRRKRRKKTPGSLQGAAYRIIFGR